MNNLNPPYKVRAGLYILIAISAPIVAYLGATGVLGELEIGLYTGLVSVVSSLAALNVTKN